MLNFSDKLHVMRSCWQFFVCLIRKILLNSLVWIINKRIVYRWLLIVSFEQCAAYSLLVSAAEILFASNISTIKQESSWQHVRYYLEVGVNYFFYKLRRFMHQEDRVYTLHIERDKSFVYIAGNQWFTGSSYLYSKVLRLNKSSPLLWNVPCNYHCYYFRR